MELQLFKRDIDNESDYPWLEEDMNYYCKELLEDKNLPLVTFELSYSQGSLVQFKKFNMSFDELIKYLLEIKELTQEKYDILYAAYEEGLYDFDYSILSRNKVEVETSIYNIENAASTNKTLTLLKEYYKDDERYVLEDGYTRKSLDDILDSDEIESYIYNILNDISYELKKYGYDLIESEDEYQCKNILFDNFMILNNIETNIDYYEGGEYLKNNKELLKLNIPIETYTRINDNNINDYYISNDIINSIELKERTVQYYLLTI